MKNIMKKRIILILCLLWMGAIFYNSSKSGEESNDKSRYIVKSAVEKKYIDKIEDNNTIVNRNLFIKKLNYTLRKFAHGFEFLVIGILLSLLMSSFKIKKREIIINTLFIVLLYATLDEFHQLYIPGRNGNVKDVLIDFLGGIIGVTLFNLSSYIKKIIDRRKLTTGSQVSN